MRQTCAGIAIATVIAAAAQAGDLVYQPVNPSFGGDPFNSSHLLGLAERQNEYDDQTFTPVDPLDRFAEDIERRVLSQASREITDRIFGEQAQDSGEFSVGNSRIVFEQVGDEVLLTLINTESGAETNLTIPAPQF